MIKVAGHKLKRTSRAHTHTHTHKNSINDGNYKHAKNMTLSNNTQFKVNSNQYTIIVRLDV